MKVDEGTAGWLLGFDPALDLQVRRDLLGEGKARLAEARNAMRERGWARELLDRRGRDGHWGRDVYGPKWTCTHYVLYELAQLGLDPSDRDCRESCLLLLGYPRGLDGGVNYARTADRSDVCINGMILFMESYFGMRDARLEGLVDYLLERRMKDGGWNCEYFHGARHSSLHTTIAVLEGCLAYGEQGYRHRAAEVEAAAREAIEFILAHRLFKSEKTGEVIKDEFFKFSFPVRWKYDILRCLDLFRKFDIPYDPRMEEALALVEKAGGKEGRWKSRSQAGKTYFKLEQDGGPGRWNSLRALRVLGAYGGRASDIV
jgi:hypothetical protein